METLTDAYDPGLMRCRCADEHYVSAPQRSNAICGFCSATYDRRNGDIHAPQWLPVGGEQRCPPGLLVSNGKSTLSLSQQWTLVQLLRVDVEDAGT